jgi:hypothetical protein
MINDILTPFAHDTNANRMSKQEYDESNIHERGHASTLFNIRAHNYQQHLSTTFISGLAKFIADHVVEANNIDWTDTDKITEAFEEAISKYVNTTLSTDNTLYSPAGTRDTAFVKGSLMTVPEYTVHLPYIQLGHISKEDTSPLIFSTAIGSLEILVDGAVCYEDLNDDALLVSNFSSVVSKYIEDDIRKRSPYYAYAFRQVGDIGTTSTTIEWRMTVPISSDIQITVLDTNHPRFKSHTYEIFDQMAQDVFDEILEAYGMTENQVNIYYSF